MQVQVKPSFYQSFGGLNFMEDSLVRLEFETLITRYLGERNAKAAYSYADVLKSLFYMFAIGGSVPDDLNTLRYQMGDHPDFTPCSPDTVEYVCKGLKQPTHTEVTQKAVQHQTNEHDDFNRLLPALCVLGAVCSIPRMAALWIMTGTFWRTQSPAGRVPTSNQKGIIRWCAAFKNYRSMYKTEMEIPRSAL